MDNKCFEILKLMNKIKINLTLNINNQKNKMINKYRLTTKLIYNIIQNA